MKSEDAEVKELTTMALVEALKELKGEVKGCRSDVKELRGAVSEMFKELLREAIVITRVEEEQKASDARLTLLERRVTVLERGAEAPNTNGSGAASGPAE